MRRISLLSAEKGRHIGRTFLVGLCLSFCFGNMLSFHFGSGFIDMSAKHVKGTRSSAHPLDAPWLQPQL
jgi:hypothetical protein